ncbi:MAG: hypothetical protein HN929_03020, partial [Chloroflexi bacterium]|nr:hypothetical protein [Chloroflexota bacterium]
MSTDDIKAQAVSLLIARLRQGYTAEEKGTADIPDFADLVRSAQRNSFAEGVWQSDFTVSDADPNLYWNNNAFVADREYGPQASYGKDYEDAGDAIIFLKGTAQTFAYSNNAAYTYLNINRSAGKLGSEVRPWEVIGHDIYYNRRNPRDSDSMLRVDTGVYRGYQWVSSTPSIAAAVTYENPSGQRLRKCALLHPNWRKVSLYPDIESVGYSQAGTKSSNGRLTYIIPEAQSLDYSAVHTRFTRLLDAVRQIDCNAEGAAGETGEENHLNETLLVPYAAATSKMYLQFATNLINGLRMRHALIGPWAPDIDLDPKLYWEEVFGGFECDNNNVKEYKEDWLEQIENSPADIRAAWNARIIEPRGLNTLNAAEAQMNTQFRQWTFARGLDEKGMNLMKMSDELEKNPNSWQTFVAALPFTEEAGSKSPSYFNGVQYAEGQGENPLGHAIIDGIATCVAPGRMSHPSYIPEIPLAGASGRDTHPLKGLEDDRFINVPGIPSPRGVFDSVNTISLLKDGKTMYALVEELYHKWYVYRFISAQSSFNGSDCGSGTGDISGQAGIDIPGHTPADYAANAADRAQAAIDAPALLALAGTSPLEATFREQCYLLSDIFNLAGKRPTDGKPLPYVPPEPSPNSRNGPATNASIEVNGTPFGFMNMLTGDPKMYPLMQAHHSQLSALQPTIRLFKVTDKTAANGDRSQQEQEFNFDSHEKNYKEATTATMLQNSRTRGHGAGIKNFEFTYDGSNPFAAKKSIKATLTIFANSFDELMK